MRDTIIHTRGYDPRTSGNELSLKIASYPATARYLAQRLKGRGRVVCELCCGIGISLIELSASFRTVIGVDSDQAAVQDCHNNLRNAGVTNYQLICGNITDQAILKTIKADVVLYDIPYWSTHAGQVDPKKQNPDLQELITRIRAHITANIGIYAPPHMSYAHAAEALGPCDFVEVYTNGKHDRNFIFLGGLANRTGVSRITC